MQQMMAVREKCWAAGKAQTSQDQGSGMQWQKHRALAPWYKQECSCGNVKPRTSLVIHCPSKKSFTASAQSLQMCTHLTCIGNLPTPSPKAQSQMQMEIWETLSHPLRQHFWNGSGSLRTVWRKPSSYHQSCSSSGDKGLLLLVVSVQHCL